MAQVTLYMDDDTMARMRAAAEAAGLSMSAWLAQPGPTLRAALTQLR